MSQPLPQSCRCAGFLGCGQLLDLGVVEELRGARLIEHLRGDLRHSETGLVRLLVSIALVPA